MKSFSLSQQHINVLKLLEKYKSQTEDDWLKEGQKVAKNLFLDMEKNVPAFKKHLANNSFMYDENLNSAVIQSPPIDKDNYLRGNSREDLCWGGAFKGQAWVISATSGSSGVPYYFPRQAMQDTYYAITAEAYMRENFSIQNKSTLYINAFPMGVWIGGVFTYEAIKQVAEKGYALSIITPGINKMEVIKAVQNLASDYDQIIIGSYAPFLKDILDDGAIAGVDWQSLNIKFIFSAEAFSEDFRDYIQKKTGAKNVFKDSLNHYGTVDLGTMAHETPLSILIRRLALSNSKIYDLLFKGADKLPTLAQFDPTMFYFEEHEGGLYCSSYSGLPLYRYDLKDRGGVLTRKNIDEIFKNNGIDINSEIQKAEISETVWNLPFVYVFERSDFSVSFYAFQIYPETIRKALLGSDLPSKVTGKCTMQVVYDSNGAQILNINVELTANTKETDELKSEVTRVITSQLLSENSEYRKTSEEVGVERVTPQIIFWNYESPEYFKPGGKQKWAIK